VQTVVIAPTHTDRQRDRHRDRGTPVEGRGPERGIQCVVLTCGCRYVCRRRCILADTRSSTMSACCDTSPTRDSHAATTDTRRRQDIPRTTTPTPQNQPPYRYWTRDVTQPQTPGVNSCQSLKLDLTAHATIHNVTTDTCPREDIPHMTTPTPLPKPPYQTPDVNSCQSLKLDSTQSTVRCDMTWTNE